MMVPPLRPTVNLSQKNFSKYKYFPWSFSNKLHYWSLMNIRDFYFWHLIQTEEEDLSMYEKVMGIILHGSLKKTIT